MSEKSINKYLSESANDKLERIVHTVIALAEMLPQDIVKSCVTCDYFHEQSEVCNKFKIKPPARVIAFACEHYDNIDNDIPF